MANQVDVTPASGPTGLNLHFHGLLEIAPPYSTTQVIFRPPARAGHKSPRRFRRPTAARDFATHPSLSSAAHFHRNENAMAHVDQTFNFQGVGIEMHVGNAPGSPGIANGVNAKGPSDAASIPPNVVIVGNGGKPLSITVGSTKLQNPA